MSIAPLLAAPAVIQIHVVAAFAALVGGLAVLAARKGTQRHRALGWVFVAGMALTALSSIFIASNGHFSAIHLLTVLTLVSLPYAVLVRRRGDILAHRKAMIGLFIGLAAAGAFTLLPGRLMHDVAFGRVRTAAVTPR